VCAKVNEATDEEFVARMRRTTKWRFWRIWLCDCTAGL